MADITYQNVLLLDDNENGLIPYIPSATDTAYGVVKYDGTSITLNENGQLQTALNPSNFVQKSGDTMTGNFNVSNNDPEIRLRHADFTKGTNPSRIIYWEYKAEDGNTNPNPTQWYANRIGNFQVVAFPDGTIATEMIAYQNNPDVSTPAALQVQITPAGVASCTFPDTTCCDGEWHNVNNVVIGTAVSLNGSSSLSYTLNLPNDGKDYECIIAAEIVTGNASGNFLQVKVGSDICSPVTMCKTRTRTASTVFGSGNALIYVSSSHKIYISRNTSWNGNLESLILIGYRRIGTNS